MEERREKATGRSSRTGDADIASVGSSGTPKIPQQQNNDMQCTKNPQGCLLKGRAGIKGEAAPTTEENKVQLQHTCTLAPALWGSGAAKTPNHCLVFCCQQGLPLGLWCCHLDKAKPQV